MTTAPHTGNVVWVRRETASVLLALAPLIALDQFRHPERAPGRRAFGLVAGLSVVVCCSTIRVVVNRAAFEVGFGPWGWPRRRIPLADIVDARVEHLSPLYWGFGFGYRFVPGHSRVILRPGTGLVVTTTSGTTFGVTTRDAKRAADLINTLSGAGADSNGD